MKKMMIMAALIAVAVTANAQNRYDNYGSNNAPYGNYGGGSYGGSTYGGNYGGNYGKGENTYAVNDMMRETRMRLDRGIDRGMITRWEAKKLFDQFEFIKEKKFRFERNGFLDKFEAREIMNDLADLNGRIEHEKHDGDRYGQNWGRDYGRGGFGDRH